MNRVTKRTWVVALFTLVLVCGMAFFLGEYWLHAPQWVAAPGSPHVYANRNLSRGAVADRKGNVLLDLSDGRSYSDSAATRKSTLHWLGDRNGAISASAVSHYAGALVGYDRINGIYHAQEEEGVITLTLSEQVQNAALEAMNGRRGTVGVYNYRTGEILCALTTPTFDPDDPPDIQGDTSGKWTGVYLNRFTQSAYVPGSIFKTVTTAAALDCVKGIEDMTFYCDGKVEYGSGGNTATVTCEKAHGTVTLQSALTRSCNCAFAQIAELVGRQNMEKYIAKFQITEPVAFDGVTTAKGNYDIYGAGAASFAWSCIGQYTDTVNPARFMTYMGAVAGGGTAAKPYLVRQVTCGEETTYQAKTEKTQRIMSQEVAQTLQTYMRNGVRDVYGDGRFPAIQICGKSGTSQLGGTETSNAMFAGFALDEKYPLAFICVVENGGYGATTCIPVLNKVLQECIRVMDAA